MQAKQNASSKFLHLTFPFLSFLYLLLIFGAPILFLKLLYDSFDNYYLKLAFFAFAPLFYAVIYVLIAGVLSLPSQHAIVSGKFPRKTDNRIYFHRRLYGLCWTSVYYFVPVFFVFLSFAKLKWFLFWLFGYRGSSSFTTYPDTWIRDLPLLSFGKNVYLSNKATIGTNIVLPNGRILVDKITLEDSVTIGHLVMLAPGVHCCRRVEIGVGAQLGIKSFVGEDSKISPIVTIEHGVEIGRNVKIGIRSYVGTFTKIADDIIVPPATVIPPRSIIKTQSDVELFLTKQKIAEVAFE